MITVRNRTMIVPEEERYIGVVEDDHVASRTFIIPRYNANEIDISGLQFFLDMKYENGTKNLTVLDKVIEEERLLLTWSIAKADVPIAGTVFLQIYGNDVNGTARWSCQQSPVYVGELINTAGEYTGELSAYQALLTRCLAIESAENSREADEALRKLAEAEREASAQLTIDAANKANAAADRYDQAKHETTDINIIDLRENKLDKTGDSKDNTVTFTESTEDLDIASGESHSTIFGKILKTLKTVRTGLLGKLDKSNVATATAGQVCTANGDGTTSFKDSSSILVGSALPSETHANQIFYKIV
jgi:hypothetical protein